MGTHVSKQSAQDHWKTLRLGVAVTSSFKTAGKSYRNATIMWSSIATILAGCSSYVPFEVLNRKDRGCSDLVLFAQYFYAAAGCVLSARAGGVRQFLFDRKIPMASHFVIMALERGRNAFFNAALNSGLPMPVYLVIKNSGLCVSMLFGATLMHKTYNAKQVIGVFASTLGVIAATLALMPAQDGGASKEADSKAFLFGALLMILGVMTTALMNVVQESTFRKYGKHFQETVFYSNVLGLTTFAVGGAGILSHVRTWLGYWDQLVLPGGISISVPSLWLLLLVNIGSQSVMKVSCLKLTSLAGSVSNVIVVTLFRFCCLVLSACVMNAPPYPSVVFWIGGLLVLGGTLSYATTKPPEVKQKAT